MRRQADQIRGRLAQSDRLGAKILVVGAGGLGVPAAVAVARAHIYDLGLIDPDVIELSNLHRQVIYGNSDIGRLKIDAASRFLAKISPEICVEAFVGSLDSGNAFELIKGFDFVIDATDTPSTKFLINDVCIEAGVPFAYGGVLGLTGQTMTVIPAVSACLRCLFENPPDAAEIASCREAGIVGPVAGFIAMVQAHEAILTAKGDQPELKGRLLTYDSAGTLKVRVMPVNPRRGCACEVYKGAVESRYAQPEGTR